MAQKFADEYVTVAERVVAFYERYPDGSIQSQLLELTDQRVTVRAEAYRYPDDPRPGIGHASMAIPGATAFTRHSELENTESSAWGRALAALGFETKRGIASADEIRMKGGTIPDRQPVPRRTPDPAPAPAAAPQDVAPAPVPDGPRLKDVLPRPGDPITPEQVPQVLSIGEALDILRRYAIPTRAISAKGRDLYRQWQLKELSPEQRAHVVQELLMDYAASGAAVAEAAPDEATSFDDGDA